MFRTSRWRDVEQPAGVGGRRCPSWCPSVFPSDLAAGAALGAYAVVGGWPELSADLLRQLDDDPLRAADVAEPIAVFVVLHLVDELTAAGSHAGDGSVDVVDCECEMAHARGVRRRL